MSTARLEPIPASLRAVPPEPLHLGYRPSLDGLRAFAVLAVMARHAYVPFFAGGAIGVDIFFVLSGFLITSLLFEEWHKTGDISLRRFYLRRVLRLIPALVLFLAFVEAYTLIVLRGPRLWEMEKAIASVVFYIANWVEAFQWADLRVLSHTWSLSVEEQFYLIWPLVFLLLLRSRQKERWILGLLGIAIALIAVRRGFMWTGPASADRIYYGGDTRSDELLAGCALGMWVHLPTFPRDRVRSIVRVMLLPAVLVIAALTVHPLQQRAMYTLGWPLVEVTVGIVILALLLGAAGPLQKLLELRPAVWIGRLSYGLYLWHTPMIGRSSAWYSLGSFRGAAGFALTFIAATASYYLVELRFLRRKRRFASV